MIAQNSIVQSKWAKDPRCKLLLHMNGTNGGTVFLDESPSPKTITVNGNTCTKTATKLLGNASAYFDGTGDYLNLTHSLSTTDNFTISGWIYFNDLSTTRTFFSVNTISSGYGKIKCTMESTHINVLYSESSGIWTNLSTYNQSYTFTTGMWYHIAIVRNSSNLNLYINGISVYTWVVGTLYNYSNTDFHIGFDYDSYTRYMNGYMDEVVFFEGVAIPISDLYPPRAQLYDYAISEWSGQ